MSFCLDSVFNISPDTGAGVCEDFLTLGNLSSPFVFTSCEHIHSGVAIKIKIKHIRVTF